MEGRGGGKGAKKMTEGKGKLHIDKSCPYADNPLY